MFDTTTDVAATIARIALAALFSGAMLSIAVAPAMAASPDDGVRVEARLVRTSDLDLTKSVDRAVLERRLAIASRVVCSDLPAEGRDNSGGFQECYAKALRDAMVQGNTAVAAVQRRTIVATTR